jgi:PAS domain-containing protein
VIRHLTVVLDPANKLTWVLDPAKENPAWSDFTGRFGPRTIRLENGKLIHQRDGRPPFELQYLGGDLFEMPATGDRIQFFRKDGRVVRLELISKENRISSAERTS